MNRNVWVVLAAGVVVAALGACRPASPPPPPPQVAPPVVPAPPLSAPLLRPAGGTLSSESWEGRPALVSFVATWDDVSRRELELLDRLVSDYASRGLVVAALAVDEAAPSAEILAGLPGSFPIGHAGADLRAAAGGVRALPTRILYGRVGGVRLRQEGWASESELRAALESAAGP